MPLFSRGRGATLAACASALTCALAPGWAEAADSLPVAVVSIQTDEALDQAEAPTTALKQSLRKTPGWSLQEGEWALEVLTVSLECAEPPDAACETKMADQLKAERLLWGTLKKKNASTVTGELHLWTRGEGSKATTVTYSANLTEANEESLRKVASDALVALTGGAPEGMVRLRVGTLTGQVLENGVPVGSLVNGQATLSLPVGRHALVVRGQGTTDLETIVEVKPLATTEISLTPQAPETGPDWQKIAGFGTIGLGLGFAAVGVISSLRIQALNDDLDDAREEVPTDQDVCDVVATSGSVDDAASKAIAACDEAGTFEALQMVMYPLAAVSIGTGIVLLSTADWSGEPETAGAPPPRGRPVPRELVLHPRVGVGPRGVGEGDVRLTYTF